VRQQRARLRGEGLRLTALDPSRVLARGYAIVAAADGAVLHSVAQVTPGDALSVRVADGAFGATVTTTDDRP
jgi:exodeoxyribonuclease VII large subunit